jgi:hypothetical protein
VLPSQVVASGSEQRCSLFTSNARAASALKIRTPLTVGVSLETGVGHLDDEVALRKRIQKEVALPVDGGVEAVDEPTSRGGTVIP